MCETCRTCHVCRIPLDRHLRCVDCTILIGPTHYETSAVDGRCSICAASPSTTPSKERRRILTAGEVTRIRSLAKLGIPQANIARLIGKGISTKQISKIVCGRAWRGVA